MNEMQYPLFEKIGEPTLLVGRKKDFAKFQKWLDLIPNRASKSRAIIARRKSGKTVFIQRIFNQLWSQNGQVIPFYFDIQEKKMWTGDFAISYFATFASHYISFKTRQPHLVTEILNLEQIIEYGRQLGNDSLIRDAEIIWNYTEKDSPDLAWSRAYHAPHVYAGTRNERVLVMIDEFQNITQYIYPTKDYSTPPDETMAGSFHSVAESKVAPMLVTGSYVGWLITIIDKYLEAGRLSLIRMSPYLEQKEGLEAVYRYAQVYNQPVTNLTAILLNELCMYDPFFISSVILNDIDDKDLTTVGGIVDAVYYEVTDRESEMSKTWREYIDLTVSRVNEQYAKHMLLHLSKHNKRYWTPAELKEELKIDLPEADIQRRLLTLHKSDLIEWGKADIDFRGLQDGTLNLILRNRYGKEIEGYESDLKEEFREKNTELKKQNRSLRGLVSYLEGMLAENLLAAELRSKKRIRLSEYFTNVQDDRELNLIDVRERAVFYRADGKKGDIDVLAKSKDGREVMVEVKKHKERIGQKVVEDFLDKTVAYAQQFNVTVLPTFLSYGGFTKDATTFCKANGVAMAEEITFFEFA